MVKISAVGDTAFLLPLSLVLLTYLVVTRRTPWALAFTLALVAGGAATLGAKLLFNACGGSVSSLDVISPSGHASFSAVVYGSLAIMAGARRARWQQVLLAVAALVGIGAVAASRVALGWHSVGEVVIGLALGGVSVAMFDRLRRRVQVPPLSPALLALGAAVLLLLVGGRHVTPEGLIVRWARELSTNLDICADAPRRQTELRLLRGAR